MRKMWRAVRNLPRLTLRVAEAHAAPLARTSLARTFRTTAVVRSVGTDAPVTVAIEFPSEYAGSVIGAAGIHLRMVHAFTGAVIVTKTSARGQPLEVELKGTVKQVEEARLLMEGLGSEGKQVPRLLDEDGPKTVAVMEIPDTRIDVGRVIGKRNIVLHTLERFTGADLKFDYEALPGTRHRCLTIHGTDEQVCIAFFS